MYEYITGRVETLSPTAAVLEAGGIGYWLNISLQTFSQIGDRAEVRLYTHFVVREDAQLLYGFFSREERDKIGAVCPANEALPLRQAADGTFDEALSALTMLGFARQASEKVLRALRKEMPAATVEELVRQALKRL